MAETLLNQVLNDEIELKEFLEWLTQLNYQDRKFVELSTKYKCGRTDFISFFLNFIHEDIGSAISEKRLEHEETKSSSEINRSHSFPLDLSSECDSNITNSTPKMTKVNSDSSMLSYMSPVSPIYKHNSFTTPKGPRSSLCLGDFITTKRVSSKKKSSENRRRIKPTNLSQSKANGFQESENSFNFNQSEIEEIPVERNFLVEEKLKILSRNDLKITNPKILSKSLSGEIKPDPELVSHRKQLDQLVEIYVQLLDNTFVLNLTSEIYFLISLLLKKQFYTMDWGIDVLSERVTATQLFNTVHNIVYFACKSLQHQIPVLRNYDNSTLRLLSENQRLRHFSPTLLEDLQKVSKPDRIVEIESGQNNICFNSDTDNRQNFPNDPSFHAFRKQRDLFYEILRIWEQHHSAPDFNYVVSLGGKIRTLLNLSNEPTNFIHFSRLFKAQLLSACRNSYSDNFMTSLDVDAQKLSKLRSRCVTKGTCQGLNALPVFSEGEEFYRDFILVGANLFFNRHLSDSIIEEITELNESNFGSNELEEEEEDANVDFVTKKQYYSCIKSLRILAKFLGFIESLPYKTDCNNYSENLLTTHLKIRRQILPTFDVKSLLENSIRRQSVILCVPWLIKYLSMLDYVTLKLPYYTQIHSSLFWIYRNFDWAPDPNIYLVKFCLGWLFELPHVPDNNYLQFCTQTPSTIDETREKPKFCVDQYEIIDQDILYFCCPYLDEIKKLLSATSTSHSIKIKHITPVTALQSPDEVARKKLEQQLEETFFNGQPVSIRKTVEFVSERVASTCVKYVCNVLVPTHKKTSLEKFKSVLFVDTDEDLVQQKIALKAQAQEFALACLKELQLTCQTEIETISEQKIEQSIESLVSLDILPQTKKVCVGIARKTCLERIRQWTDSHVTLGVFTKDFNDEVERVTGSGSRKAKRPVFMLPPGGDKARHNDKTTSAAHLLEKYRDLTLQIIELNPVTKEAVVELLDDTFTSVNERGDFNQCILATICTQLLDLALLLLAHHWQILVQDGVLSKSCDIWRLYYNGCDDLFKSLLCPRNVMILGQSRNRKESWDTFAKFCAYLIKNNLLSCEVFESQCTGIFRCDWDQDTLKLITDFFKRFASLYRDEGGSASDFTFLLEFFSDYCEDLF